MLEHRIEQSFAVRYSYPVCFTRHAFEPSNTVLADLIRQPGRERAAQVLFAVDSGLAAARPGLLPAIEHYARAHADAIRLAGPAWIVRGGETSKEGLREVDALYAMAQDFGLCRHSYVVAIGGGAVLDAVGFAAATAHRGLRLIRMPSTVLAQNDAGVGVKNAVNWHGRKNFVGTFVPPFAVVNDFDLLSGASAADRRAGIAEAVKVALIRDADFFDEIHRQRFELARLAPHALEPLIVRCAELHLAQIRNGGDPFEHGSARPLDFGHWVAHKLEELSHHRLRHGEAVAIGIAVDTLYSQRLGMIGAADASAVLSTLRDIGFVLDDDAFGELDIAQALNEFREHLGGQLCITLLARIGQGVEVDTIDIAAMQECIAALRGGHPAIQLFTQRIAREVAA
ncbi:3-dehydroquinate synthase [Paraburkholderia tagetis]|uniref:3-dehydroquinate synthase n=1 Tax=Paraburkholderia tagetis TaxID=2913261 RepID=A0A9X1RQT1_9BURK|nr:3-dehydroquinate synthase [Paraburkholderia tagetis]MCG5075080.1 3-dehydroquinate synthase [Paraburkholderia tagetis]